MVREIFKLRDKLQVAQAKLTDAEYVERNVVGKDAQAKARRALRRAEREFKKAGDELANAEAILSARVQDNPEAFRTSPPPPIRMGKRRRGP